MSYTNWRIYFTLLSIGPPSCGHECSGSTCLPDKSWLGKTGRYDHFRPTRCSAACNGFAIMVYRCVRGLGPAYLADALQPVVGIPGRQRLRSSLTSALDVPIMVTYELGNIRAFSIVAARTRNSLPAEVTSSNSLQTFKTKLKSHLFLAVRSIVYFWL